MDTIEYFWKQYLKYVDEFVFNDLDKKAHIGCNAPDFVNIESPYNGSKFRKRYWKKVKEI